MWGKLHITLVIFWNSFQNISVETVCSAELLLHYATWQLFFENNFSWCHVVVVYIPARLHFPGCIFQRCSYLIFSPHRICLTGFLSLAFFRTYQAHNWNSSTWFCKIITQARAGHWDTSLSQYAHRFPENTYHCVGQGIPHLTGEEL